MACPSNSRSQAGVEDETGQDSGVEFEEVDEEGYAGEGEGSGRVNVIANCPTSVNWLIRHFEYNKEKSLPRGFVYDQYCLLCGEHGLEPVNAASFGKLIRSVFPGLKTRRLGTRGNSKYHYNGVYLRSDSPLVNILGSVRAQQGLMYDHGGKRGKRIRKTEDGRYITTQPKPTGPKNYLGRKPEMDAPFADFVLHPSELPNGLNSSPDFDVATIFETMYNDHCKALLTALEAFDMNGIVSEWKRFWRVKAPEKKRGDKNYAEIMSKTTLFKLCTVESASQFIQVMDLSTYQYALDILFPCMYQAMPMSMAQDMKVFVLEVEPTLVKIMGGYPTPVVMAKFRALRTFINMWTEFVRVNRMTVCVEQVLLSDDSVQGMKSELNRAMDYDYIMSELADDDEDASWTLMHQLLVDFKNLLESPGRSPVTWFHWIDCTVKNVLNQNNQNGTNYPDVVRVWRMASDSITGAIAKGNAGISLGVFKVLISWCDKLFQYMVKTHRAQSSGFILHIFYYESTMEMNDEAVAKELMEKMDFYVNSKIRPDATENFVVGHQTQNTAEATSEEVPAEILEWILGGITETTTMTTNQLSSSGQSQLYDTRQRRIIPYHPQSFGSPRRTEGEHIIEMERIYGNKMNSPVYVRVSDIELQWNTAESGNLGDVEDDSLISA